jgi:hypothetical protein
MKVLIYSLAITTLVLIGSSIQVQAQKDLVNIPPSLNHAAEFVEFLNKNHVRVLEVTQSHFSGFLGSQKMAAFIRTDQGNVEVVFLDEDIPLHKITITYQKGNGSSNHHLYTVTAPKRKTESMNAAYSIYFTLHRHWDHHCARF